MAANWREWKWKHCGDCGDGYAVKSGTVTLEHEACKCYEGTKQRPGPWKSQGTKKNIGWKWRVKHGHKSCHIRHEVDPNSSCS